MATLNSLSPYLAGSKFTTAFASTDPNDVTSVDITAEENIRRDFVSGSFSWV